MNLLFSLMLCILQVMFICLDSGHPFRYRKNETDFPCKVSPVLLPSHLRPLDWAKKMGNGGHQCEVWRLYFPGVKESKD